MIFKMESQHSFQKVTIQRQKRHERLLDWVCLSEIFLLFYYNTVNIFDKDESIVE